MPYARLWGERVVRSVANLTRQDAKDFLELAARTPIQTYIEQLRLGMPIRLWMKSEFWRKS